MLPPSILTSLIVITTLAIRPSTAQSATQTSSSSSSSPTILTQHIFHPAHKDVLVPGTISTIRWTANPAFQNITLQLWDNTSWGYSRDLLTPCIPWGRNPFCGTIAVHAPNTGAFDWYVPNPANGTPAYGFPRDEQVFWVKLFVEDYLNEKVGNARPVVSWSQNFAFAAEGEKGTVVEVPEGSSYGGDWDGMPVYVTDGVSGAVAASSTLDTAVATTSVSTTTTGTGTGTATATSTHAVPKNGLVTQVAKGEAVALEKSPGMWIVGVLSLVLGSCI